MFLVVTARPVVLVLAMAVAAGGYALLRASTHQSPSPQPSQRIEIWKTGPAGQVGPVTVIVPNFPANPGQPKRVGPFRLLPFGYFDPVGSTPVPYPTCERPTIDRAVVDAAIAASRVNAHSRHVPAGFTVQPAETEVVCGGDIRAIRWTLTRVGGGPIEIHRGIAPLPFDVRVPPDTSWYSVREGSVRGRPAVFEENKPGEGGTEGIYFADGDIITIVHGNIHNDFGELLRIAEGIE
ncbi:MAG: hypothetical protein HY874_00250 [Chloroflexi bacterium]|nr:hypothetical protein [Chloroflexota bacterium]